MLVTIARGLMTIPSKESLYSKDIGKHIGKLCAVFAEDLGPIFSGY